MAQESIRIGKADSPGKVIYQGWKNRDSPKEGERLELADVDEDFAARLLRPRVNPDRAPANAIRLAETLASNARSVDHLTVFE